MIYSINDLVILHYTVLLPLSDIVKSSFLITSHNIVYIFVTLRSLGLVLSLVQLFIQVHQPCFDEQSHPHGGAGLLHADRRIQQSFSLQARIQQHSVQLLLQSAAKCQVKTFTSIIVRL